MCYGNCPRNRYNMRTTRTDCSTGINCMGHPAQMYWDKKTSAGSPDSAAAGKKRRELAGCGSNNRCSKPPYGKGFDCDEFPFKSIDPGRLMHTSIPSINRCVPSRSNKRKSSPNLTRLEGTLILTLLHTVQGNALRQFYRSEGPLYTKGGGLDNQEGWYTLAFQGYAGISYCEDASTRNCNNGMLNHKIGRLHRIITLLTCT